MATLAESFLADLDELDEAEAPAVAPGGGAPPPPSGPAARLLQLAQSDDLDAVAPLVHSERFAGVLRRVEAARGSAAQPRAGPVDDDPEYKLIVDCNALTADIDAEIGAVHAYVRDRCVVSSLTHSRSAHRLTLSFPQLPAKVSRAGVAGAAPY